MELNMITFFNPSQKIAFSGSKHDENYLKSKEAADFLNSFELETEEGVKGRVKSHKDTFDKISDTAQEFVSNGSEKFKDVVKTPVKYAGVALFTGVGFLSGKYMFSSQIAKSLLKFSGDLLGGVTKIDLPAKINHYSDEVLKVAKKFKDNQYPKIDKFLGEKKAAVVNFIEEFSKKGVKEDEVKHAASISKTNPNIAIERARVQNATLKTIGAVVGIFTGLGYFKKAMNTDAEKMPALFKEQATDIAKLVVPIAI